MTLEADVRRTARQWLAASTAAIVVEVIGVRGSAPRPAGTRMLVSARHTCGTIGGGRLELEATGHARSLLCGAVASAAAAEAPCNADAAAAATGAAAPVTTLHRALGPSLGQCCGGAVTLSFRRLDAAALACWPEPAPLLRVQMHGAGHVGTAIARVLATLDVQLDWIDSREPAFAPGAAPDADGPEAPWPDRIRRLCVDAVEAEVDAARPGDAYLVLTHDHDLDLRLAHAILQRGDFGWFGLIGSATKRARFERRLAARGIAPQRLARMVCPIGLPQIAGSQPEIIAVAVVAQLLAHATARPQTRP